MSHKNRILEVSALQNEHPVLKTNKILNYVNNTSTYTGLAQKSDPAIKM